MSGNEKPEIVQQWSGWVSTIIGFTIIPYIFSYWYQKAYWDFLGASWVVSQLGEYSLLMSSDKIFSYVLSVGFALLIVKYFNEITIKKYFLIYIPLCAFDFLVGRFLSNTIINDFSGAFPLALTLAIMIQSSVYLTRLYRNREVDHEDFLRATESLPETTRNEALSKYVSHQSKKIETILSIEEARDRLCHYQSYRTFTSILPNVLIGITLLYGSIYSRGCLDAFNDENLTTERLPTFYDKDHNRYYLIGTLETGMLAFKDYGKGYMSSVHFIPNENGPFIFAFGKKFRFFRPPSTLESNLELEEKNHFTDDSLSIEEQNQRFENRFKDYRALAKTTEQKKRVEESYLKLKKKDESIAK